ncbi:hypothetical protein SODALDRAFT_161598 [Sodiomyces alkalinus F11]|uniref:2EXR domain-containing protein n=1 Tax=Sodiomyces alkalinus (strain CBS 110278 / VKM F-3762 / F11) TaxID=1314773 RepID=A0A3N2PV96_SODAK|nr:hypothetical protein SODALDRAFT_161598 [Sodiomyces alkalinus F11]ROT38394.1 hypothetical protein SODALDRAFT_161598 [Sodiomyces alkalinus F11]
MAPQHSYHKAWKASLKSGHKRHSAKQAKAPPLRRPLTIGQAKSYSRTLVDPKFRTKKFHLFEKLPGELREQIYLYAFQSGPSIVYVTPKIHPPKPRRAGDRISLVQGRLGYESKWKWAAEVAAVIPEAKAAFEKQFGKRTGVRHDQLVAVRPWDLVVYIFDSRLQSLFGMDFAKDNSISREARERLVGTGQVRNVSVRWDGYYCYGIRCHCRIGCSSSLALSGNICLWGLTGFLYNFPDLENVFIQFQLNGSHMDRSMTNKGPKELVDSLAAKARKDPSIAMFQDRCRTWVEIRERDMRKWLRPQVIDVYHWIQSARKEFDKDLFRAARLPAERRRSVQFRLLVSSWYKVDRRLAQTAKSND